MKERIKKYITELEEEIKSLEDSKEKNFRYETNYSEGYKEGELVTYRVVLEELKEIVNSNRSDKETFYRIEIERLELLNEAHFKNKLEFLKKYGFDNEEQLRNHLYKQSKLLELYKEFYNIINKRYEIFSYILNGNDVIRVNEIFNQIKEIENEKV